MAASILYERITESSATSVAVVRNARFSSFQPSTFKKPATYQMLCTELEIQTVLPKLVQHGVINQDEFSKIGQQKYRRRKVATLLEILFSRPNELWVDHFLLTLEKCGQSHMIERLKNPPESPIPHRIRELRPVQYHQRVLLYEEDIEESIRRKYNSEILKTAREILNSDLITVYKGSLCFVLDPLTKQAIEDLWNKTKNSAKVQQFIKSLLQSHELKERFEKKRIIRVEIEEKQNDFLFHVEEQSNANGTYKPDLLNPKACSACLRQTVVDNYETMLDEVETTMIEETFKDSVLLVPGYIIQACIKEKAERSRQERADIFLQFVLTHERLVIDFFKAFNKISDVKPNIVACKQHSGLHEDYPLLREKIVMHFEIYYDRTDDVIIVNALPEKLNNMLADKQDEKLLQIEDIKENENMDRSNHYRLIDFLYRIQSNVVCKYFETRILQQTTLESFLRDHKHSVYHLAFPNRCCKCLSPNHGKKTLINVKQFESMFDKSNETCITSKCICMYSAKTNLSIDGLDFSVVYSIIKHCGGKLDKDDDKMMTTIKDIRNTLFTCPSCSSLCLEVFSGMLEAAVLGLASKIDQQYAKNIKREIILLKNKNYFYKNQLTDEGYSLQKWCEDEAVASMNIPDRLSQSIYRRNSSTEVGTSALHCCKNTKSDLFTLEEDEIRIAVIEKYFGKHSVAKMLLNTRETDSSELIGHVTRRKYTDLAFGKKFVVIGTTGEDLFFPNNNELSKDIARIITLTSPGPHAIIVAVRNSLFIGDKIDEIISPIAKLFGPDIVNYIIISLILESSAISGASEIMIKGSSIVQELVRKERVMYLDSEKLQLEHREFLVEKVLQLIDQTASSKGKSYFTNQMYLRSEELISEKMIQFHESSLDKYRTLESQIAYLKSKIFILKKEQNQIKRYNEREVVLSTVEKDIYRENWCAIL